MENRRGDDNFDGSLLNQFLERTSKIFRSELLNQSMEKRGDESFGKSAQPVLGEKEKERKFCMKIAQPVHGEKMQKPRGVIRFAHFSLFNEWHCDSCAS